MGIYRSWTFIWKSGCGVFVAAAHIEGLVDFLMI